LNRLALVVILIVVVVAALAGPSVLLSSRLENDARRSLRAQDGSARVIAGPLGVLQGRLARLDLRAHGAMFDGTSVDAITLELRGVTIDPVRAFRGELVVRGVERGSVTMVVGEESLRRYLESRDVRNPAVRMERGVVTMTGQVRVLNALVDVTLRAGLLVRDGIRLAFDIQELRVGGLEVPRDIGNALAASINPILTAPQQPVPLRFTGVTIDAGAARVVGEVAR
jgi:hypothetical protein